MLEYIRTAGKKIGLPARIAALVLPVVCVVLVLTQTVFAKTTYVINDGGQVLVHTTYTTDPAAVLDEAGLKLGEDDIYTTEASLGMSEITIQRKQTVHIVYGGKNLSVITYGETVESLLNRLEIPLKPGVVISAAPNASTYDGMTVTISQTLTQEETYTVTVPFETEYCYDASLAEGKQVILTQGVEGQTMYTASVHYVDGQEVDRVVLSQTVLSKPVNTLIAVGTAAEPEKEEQKKPAKKPSSSKKFYEAEMPQIGDGLIVTADGEVLTYTDSLKVKATAYNNVDPGCTIYTAIGTLCRVGAIAVDPKVIPYGTRMFIVSDDGKYIYGVAVAEDCGGAIKGNRIDLYFDTVSECNTFGVRNCTVYFLG